MVETFKIQAWGRTDVGRKRSHNEDSFAIVDDLKLYMVADGMGGHLGGEVASKTAISSMQQAFSEQAGKSERRSKKEMASKKLSEAMVRANKDIYEMSQKNADELGGMGTTLVVATTFENKIYIGHVGDSRCYLISEGGFWCLTEDHSLVNDLKKSGDMSDSQVRELVPRNVITRSVGHQLDLYPDIVERELKNGDIYLLCSDGLTTMVNDAEISRLVLKEAPGDQLLVNLINKANQNGGDDNVTAILVRVERVDA